MDFLVTFSRGEPRDLIPREMTRMLFSEEYRMTLVIMQALYAERSCDLEGIPDKMFTFMCQVCMPL